MKNPQILILPVLMLCDYFLTVLGAIEKERKYSDHFKVQHYEMNPLWQRSVRQKKWFNPRHLILVISITVLTAGALEFCELPEPFVQGLFGFYLVMFGMVIGRHVSNILTFRHVARCQEEISGEVVLGHGLVLSMSTYQYLVAAFPVVAIAIFTPSAFVMGGVAGVMMLFAVHAGWSLRQKKKRQTGSLAERGS